MARFPNVGKNIPELDGIRGLAIIPVLIYHFSELLQSRHTVLDNVFFKICQIGWVGVDLFFVLSGFLITGILYDTKSSDKYFTSFYGRRVLRIFPLYYGVLFALFVMIPFLSKSILASYIEMHKNQTWFWLYISNWLFAFKGKFGEIQGGYFWSLAVEEQYYLVWPLIVYLLDKSKLMYLSCALFFGSLILRIIFLYSGMFGPTSVYNMTITHMDSLVVGSMLSVIVRSENLEMEHLKYFRIVAISCVLILAGIGINSKGFAFWDFQVSTVAYSLLALLFGYLLISTLYADPLSFQKKFFNSSFMRSFGKYSYALYVFHVPISRVLDKFAYSKIRHVFGEDYQIFGTLIFILTASFVSFMLAVLSWNLYEKHFLKMKYYFRY